MLKRLTVRGFKSLVDVTVDFPRLTVLFGPNAGGKSNLLDAIEVLSRIATERTLADALGEPIRGYPVEAFTFPSGGLFELLSMDGAQFSFEADLEVGGKGYRYRIAVQIAPGSGRLSVADEYLTALTADGLPKATPAIERVEDTLRVRRQSGTGKPPYEPLAQNYAILSDLRLSAPAFAYIERTRAEMAAWRTYYLDPRVAMREPRPPSDVRDIGALGEDLAPFLFKLRAENLPYFKAVVRTLRSLIPNIESLSVDLDRQRGHIDLLIRQDGVDYSARVISEGTLRVLALCAIAVNPWGGSLVAFEEPENGVHPHRIELIARLLSSLALDQGRQVVVTTHSPLFCDAVLSEARAHPGEVGLFSVQRAVNATEIRSHQITGPLFDAAEVATALASGSEDGLFESLLMRGLIDG